jgi:hypothetical protein
MMVIDTQITTLNICNADIVAKSQFSKIESSNEHANFSKVYFKN